MSENIVKLPQKVCQACSTTSGELLRCSKCKSAYYCGTDCQKSDWSSHKKVCNKDKIPSDTSKANKENVNEPTEGLNQFTNLEHVGSGNFSLIFKTTSKKDGKIYAIKQIEKNKVQRMRKEADILMEKHCLNKLKNCPHVVKLYKTFQDELSLYFQMELPEKGQLWQASKSFGVISESLFKYYAASVIKSVSVLHNQYNIVHRDLKPENILLDKQNKIKLIDFGTAKDLDRPDIKGAGNGLKGKKAFQDYVGTPHYMAPQCIHNKASEKSSDIYSLSGILYFLKVGSPPFQGGSEYLTFTKSLQKPLLTCPQLFSPQLQDLISKMNKKQMSERININGVMSHPYFKDIDFDNIGQFRQAEESATQQQKYLIKLSAKLLAALEKEKQPKLQTRTKIYEEEIKPILQQQQTKLADTNIFFKQRLFIIDIQCRTYLNLKDNTDISFTEIYEQLKSSEIAKQ